MVLSPRQYEIARLIAHGHTQAEIALMLGISRRTVEHHAARIREKAGERSTRRAVTRARAGARVASTTA